MSDRDRIREAIDRLAAAIYELTYRDRISIKPEVRVLLAPGDATADDMRHLHTIGLTAQLAERLAEAAEQLLSTERTEGGELEQANPELAAAINAAFSDLDLVELANTVLTDTDPQDRKPVTRALDAMFGDVTDPEAEEDE